MNKRIAVIRIRGHVGIKKTVETTMKMLRLYNKHNCIIIQNKPVYVGMLKKIKDYVTWGELDNETFKLLLQSRGRLPGNKKLTEQYLKEKTKMDLNSFAEDFMNFKKELKDIPGLKQFFKLKPPTGGYERGGVKNTFAVGGTLGYRKDRINALLRRMI